MYRQRFKSPMVKLCKKSGYRWERVIVAALVAGAVGSYARAQTVYFDIPEEPLGVALLRFARQSQLPVLFPSDTFADIKANPINGNFQLEEALMILLEGTGFEASITAQTRQLVIRAIRVDDEDEKAALADNEGDEVMVGDNPNVRRRILFSAMAALFAGTGTESVNAQQREGSIEEIAVTGSRIRATSGFETSTPVTSLSVEELRDYEPGNTISQQLSNLPQFFGNRTTQMSSGGSRFSPAANTYSFLNLRNLGGNRTLVLIDGHRLPPSDKDGTVNSDLIPTELMRSVDVVTGGASAAYGADAVGGVVNFVLDREFKGLKANIGSGVHETGAGQQWQVGLAGGTSFFNDRLHVIGSFESREIKQIRGDRSSVSNFERIGWVKNPAWSPGATGVPQRLTLPNVVSTLSSPNGLISAPGTAMHRKQFSLDGRSLIDFIPGDVVSWPGEPGGTSSMSGGPESGIAYQTFDNSPAAANVVSRAYFGGLKFDVTDRLSVRGDVRGGRTESNNNFIRGGFELESPWNILIAPDNAFLPADVRQMMVDNNISQLNISKLGSYTDRPEVGSNTVTENVLTQWHISTGFEYRFEKLDWVLDGHFQRARSKSNPEGHNVIRQDRLYLGMDAVRDPNTGAIVCRVQLYNPTPAQLRDSVAGRVSSVPLDPFQVTGVEGNTKPLESPIGLDNTIRDCVPVNIFGSGNMSQQALDYVTSYKAVDGRVDQDFAELLLTGGLMSLPAGEVSFAAGLTWRQQSFLDLAKTNPGTGVDGKVVTTEELGPPINVPALGIRGIPPGIQGGSANLHLFSTVPNIGGEQSVWEWFAELHVPVWEAAIGNQYGFEQQLDLTLAYRQSEYRRSGVADSWKVGFDFRFHRDWRLRVTSSQDMREPTFQELFDAQGGGSSVLDPRFNNATVQTNTLSGGNPDLAPEVGRTLTGGIVWQPQAGNWLSGFQVALDWYDIKISDRVTTLNAQRILNECHLNNILCDQIIRDSAGQLVNIRQTFLNLSDARVRGTDLEVSWRTEPNFLPNTTESFTLRWLGAYLNENSTTAFGGTPLDVAGVLNTPKYTHVLTANYGFGPYFVQLQNRYVDSVRRDVNWVQGVDVDINTVSMMTWWNARLGYNGEMANGATWNVSLNIQNLMDRAPPVVPGFSTRGGTQQFNNSYDIFGRRYNLSANYNF